MSSSNIETSHDIHTPPQTESRALKTLNWSSLGFAVLQNICAAVLAVNGIRIAIGLGSLAAAGGILPTILRFHSDAIRIPMMILALVGSVINLFALWQIRRLRNRPAAQWRRIPLNAKQIRSEHWQFALSIITLALLTFEYFLHRHLTS
jgi:hypothetical protein